MRKSLSRLFFLVTRTRHSLLLLSKLLIIHVLRASLLIGFLQAKPTVIPSPVIITGHPTHRVLPPTTMNPSMDHPQGFLDSQGCLESLAGFLYQFYKLFCGAMIGSAFLFPLANTGEFWFRAITLLIFVLAAVAFHGLYLEPFVRYGLYVYPASMMFLLLHVFKTEYLEMDITPWLPLFICCLPT
ncbi:hypothetical protein B0H63DRAFT_38977 [Podospora didyma]|uniref:Uncharacterized protein n=1 Tax=Podospora didyma TaxID=330526 RepID=A0AAE0U873_9PEZI|nr:hypothetical protein B0H63DRAFT_38977 [Podospora didyma]